jgi:lipopolysaccharide biosynthesis protein
LCWANENWTRRWDGDDSQILLRQSHSREDHGRVFDDMARYLEDPRYLRVEERPVVVVYRPAIIDDVRAMTDIWREKARLRGWKDLFLIATNAFNLERAEPLGFDALCQFPPHGFQADRIEHRLDKLNVGFGGTVFDYAAVAEGQIAALRAQTQAGLLPGVMPGWDNEARRPGAGVIYHGASPPVYEAWLRAAIDQVIRTQPPERRLVFINAWNEWAEGAHLEPDRRFGRAFLAATARALT